MNPAQILRDYLNFYDGLIAFLGDAPPSQEQWARIKERHEDMKKATAQMPPAPMGGGLLGVVAPATKPELARGAAMDAGVAKAR